MLPNVDCDFYSLFFWVMQGYLPVEASVLDVEVWGLGGEATKRQQNVYKKREDIFSEQRRKVLIRANLNHLPCSYWNVHVCPQYSHFLFQVDLKTFASWEDSPEKMMMDMMSDPNTVQREDRWFWFIPSGDVQTIEFTAHICLPIWLGHTLFRLKY